jgi:hypothetical protein
MGKRGGGEERWEKNKVYFHHPKSSFLYYIINHMYINLIIYFI